MERYYYINTSKEGKQLGMMSSGSFTADKSQWITFTKAEKNYFLSEGVRPYAATKPGMFYIVND